MSRSRFERRRPRVCVGVWATLLAWVFALCAMLPGAAMAAAGGVAVTRYDAKWPSVVEGPINLSWAGDGAVPRARFAAELAALDALPPGEANARARALSDYAALRQGEMRWAAMLLAAAAYGRGGDLASARANLDSLNREAPKTPYGKSAQYRLRLLEARTETEAHEAMYRAPDAVGWYQNGGDWSWTHRRQAARRELGGDAPGALASGDVRGLPFFLVLLGVAVVGQLLMLPLVIQAMRHATDPYARRNGSARRGFLEPTAASVPVLLEAGFLVLAALVLGGFSPQVSFADERFLWVEDVNQFSGGLTFLTVAAGAYVAARRSTDLPGPQAAAGAAAVGIAAVLVASAFQWPAYLFVFFLIVSLVGMFSQRAVAAVVTGAGGTAGG